MRWRWRYLSPCGWRRRRRRQRRELAGAAAQPLVVLARTRVAPHAPGVPGSWRWPVALPARPAAPAAPISIRSPSPAPTAPAAPSVTFSPTTFTDALVVLQEGELATEWYSEHGARRPTHLLMSVTKSVVGGVAAVLIGRGASTPTVRSPTTCRSWPTAATREPPCATSSTCAPGSPSPRTTPIPTPTYAASTDGSAWRPRGSPSPSEPLGLYSFLATLGADRPHGGEFRYRSAETDVLGWVCERAGGARMADLVSALIWAPMGAEHDGDFICDGLGTAVHDGGLCVTARDLARFGQLLLDGGAVPGVDQAGGTHTVVPPSWLREAWAADSDVRAAFAASPAEVSLPGGWYRNQFWFRPGQHGDVLVCLGIHGQMLHVNRSTRTVCVKFSSWPLGPAAGPPRGHPARVRRGRRGPGGPRADRPSRTAGGRVRPAPSRRSL